MYRRHQVQRALDFLELQITEDLYETDLREAIETIYNIWNKASVTTIQKCWAKSTLVVAVDKSDSARAENNFPTVDVYKDVQFKYFFEGEDLDCKIHLFKFTSLIPSPFFTLRCVHSFAMANFCFQLSRTRRGAMINQLDAMCIWNREVHTVCGGGLEIVHSFTL